MIAGEHALLEFRSLVARRLGLWFDDHRKDFIAGILRDRIAARGGDPAAYLQMIAGSGASDEWPALAALLTVTETYFLRGGDHFRAFRETVLPACVRRLPATRPLRLLSAGCSSGEEAYSIAISLREHPGGLNGRAVEIVGVDINREALAKARAGRYSEWSLRETPPEIRRKYFRPVRSEFALDESIVAMVSFQERNLAEPNDDFWQAGTFDAVFCRNMLMYFVPETAAAIVARIQRAQAPGGYLFLGHSETLRGLSQAFHLRRDNGTFYYQLRDEDEPSLPAARETAQKIHPPETTPELALADGPVAATAWMDEISRASARIASLAASAPKLGAVADATAPVPGRAEINRVFDLHQQERFTEALAHLRSLPEGTAPDADLQVLQAMLLVNCGRLAEAEALCRPLLGSDELNAGVHHVAALCREHAGDLAASEEHDAAAAYLDPSFAMPRFHLGLLCKRLGRTSDALAHFEAALALLVKEDPVRLLLFGGGFSRETLVQACRGEIQRLHRTP
jgi:chemotaxis protein methyltransferase CheR